MRLFCLTLFLILFGSLTLPAGSSMHVWPATGAPALRLFAGGGGVVGRTATDRLAVPTLHEPDESTRARVASTYGNLPLSFEVNQGQAGPEVKFVTRGNGYSLSLSSNEAVMALVSHETSFGKPSRIDGIQGPRLAAAKPNPEASAVLRMRLVNANPNPKLAGLDELPSHSNYFIGNDPRQWHANVPNYAKAELKDVYPGVNQIYHGDHKQLEYDLR